LETRKHWHWYGCRKPYF